MPVPEGGRLVGAVSLRGFVDVGLQSIEGDLDHQRQIFEG
jgi:hypothetical protein